MTVNRKKSRDEAWALLCRYTKSESLIRHALGVEAVMRSAATVYGEAGADADEWGITGLLHDFDYEQFPTPDVHPWKGAEIMRVEGFPENMIEAILGHAPYTGVERRSAMARALFAVDELSGFLVACALVRPSRSLVDLTVSSVRKKLKDKAFARTVNREDVYESARELPADLDAHINFVIESLKPVERDLGLGSETHE